MGFFEALFAGAKAILAGVVEVAALAVRIVLSEFDRSAVGRAATALANGVTQKYFSNARDLAGEERELAEKYRREECAQNKTANVLVKFSSNVRESKKLWKRQRRDKLRMNSRVPKRNSYQSH